MGDMQKILKKLMSGTDLTPEEAGDAMTEIMTGQAGEVRTAAFLTAMSMKGETGKEIEACARSMRHAAVTWPGNSDEILCDTCGTGGDSAGTINVSTISALLLASMGHKIAKHGNRAVSSSTGSADLLESLGVPLEMDHEDAYRCLQDVGITFLFAPKWHPAMKHAGPVRKAMGVRTVFNLLGPITNPAPITHQVIGVFNKNFMSPIAQALAGMGRKGAYVIHSEDGLDEVSIATPAFYVRIQNGEISGEGKISPEDFGFKRQDLSTIIVRDRDDAVRRAVSILEGKGTEAENHTICMNAALVHSLVRGQNDLKTAADECLKHLLSGKVIEISKKWAAYHNASGSVMSGGPGL